MADPQHVSVLPSVIIFCAAAVVGAPLARRLGLSSVLGYLAAGVAIGPAGAGLVEEAESVRSVAELGVVLLLFVIGLELKLSKLVAMGRDIFGVGAAQLGLTALAVGAGAVAMGFSAAGAIIVALALSLSATAVALQVLEERGEQRTPYGQRAFSVLLFQDLSIVPILALVPILASLTQARPEGGLDPRAVALAIVYAVAALGAVVVSGRYLLNPLFRVLAASGGREVMTAAALLVALGAALLMEIVGLSMALGAFLAGVLLAESNFRHQLEADIEPFRGLLLGLFFISVGMSIDLRLFTAQPILLLGLALGLCLAKSGIAYPLFRWTGSGPADALRAAALLSTSGEFSFVILPLASRAGLVDPAQSGLVTAAAALTMFAGPLLAQAIESGIAVHEGRVAPPPEPEEQFDDAAGTVLVIGFGRFGQVVNQVLMAQGVDVTVIDFNVESIRGATRFGFKVYFGNGTRIDVLRAAGAERARLVAVCVDDQEATNRIVALVQENFPQARTFVRAYDRVHSIELMSRHVDYHMRETFESAVAFGRAALEELGVAPAEAETVGADVRKRDIARLMMQQVEGLMGGSEFLHGAKVEPEPLTRPRTRSRALNPETKDLVGEARR